MLFRPNSVLPHGAARVSGTMALWNGCRLCQVFAILGLVLGACSSAVQSEINGSQGGTSGTKAGGANSTLGTGGAIVLTDVPSTQVPAKGSDAGSTLNTSCTKVTCAPSGGQYCGQIGDNCGGKLDCGPCPHGRVCESGRCVGDSSCAKLSCQLATGKYCGKVGDGCGREMDCGACPSGQTCSAGICAPANCKPLTCESGTIKFCGTIGDGCGKSLSCGDCNAGFTCGSKIAGVCTATHCKPITCTPEGGGQYCGQIGDGCGGVLDCPKNCASGLACGGSGTPNTCPALAVGAGGCAGLACNIDKCVGKSKTTVKGTVYDPGGKLPLYNVMVYVPNGPLEEFTEGVTCQKCDTAASGWPVASALSDAAGKFTLQDVPVGTDIPIVIQTGKWRRQTKLATVKACQENVFTGTDQFRLPKNKSEGHLPKIAFTRGGADGLECVLHRLGVDAAEFTNPSGPGRVNIYYERGVGTGYDSGEAFPPISQLFNPAVINKYDMVVFSCHGRSAMAKEQPAGEKKIVKDFVDQGGRVFGSHFSYGYFRGVPGTNDAKYYQASPWSVEVAQWDGGAAGPYTIETGFAKGKAFADWLVNVGASQTRGVIELGSVESPAASLTPGLGQAWIHSSGGVPYFHVSMPIEKAATPAEQCGRFVHTGIHVAQGGGQGSANEGPFPSFCGKAALNPQEMAWEFLIFELSACALPDNVIPKAPELPPPTIPVTPPPSMATPPAPPPPSPPPPPPIVF